MAPEKSVADTEVFFKVGKSLSRITTFNGERPDIFAKNLWLKDNLISSLFPSPPNW